MLYLHINNDLLLFLYSISLPLNYYLLFIPKCDAQLEPDTELKYIPEILILISIKFQDMWFLFVFNNTKRQKRRSVYSVRKSALIWTSAIVQ